MTRLDLNTPQVMGILNITPDSFYAQSRAYSSSSCHERVEEMILQGATIIDIGGYSSRPGADDISVQEEWRRVKEGLRITREIDPTIAISIDTFRAEVAQRAAEEVGEIIINDISAGEREPEIISVAAKYHLPYIAMHMRGTPQSMQSMTEYRDVSAEVVEYFSRKVLQLHEAGVEQIILDPGFGFAKSVEQNFLLLKNLNQICSLGYPTLAGVSRKSMIYKTIDSTPEDALAGSIALGWEALRQGAKILRVHDVREAVQSIKLFEAYDKSK